MENARSNIIAQFPTTTMAIAFLFVIYLPMVDQLFNLRLDKLENSEKRALAVRPVPTLDSWASFPRKYEDYFDDNFSFRILLIKINSFFSRSAFDLSPRPDVVIGKEGWLYLASETYGNSLEDHLGLIDVDNGTLELIRNNLEERTRMLESRGVRFLVVVAPDKQSIYPEYLPDQWKRKKDYPTRLDQIVKYLKAKSTVQILDVRTTLMEEKESGNLPLYRKTDSHWNYLGAFIAYQEIMNALSIRPKEKADFEWKQVTVPSGDIAGLLAAGDQYQEENEVSCSPLFKDEISFTEAENTYGISLDSKRVVALNKSGAEGKLLVIHDSFGNGLFNFLSCHFGESVFVNTNQFSTVIVEKEKPDLVIFELVERFSTSLAWKELE